MMPKIKAEHEQIPRTDSIEKLAIFWQVHDLTEFEDELEEVATPVFVRKKDINGSSGSQVVSRCGFDTAEKSLGLLNRRYLVNPLKSRRAI